MKRKRFIKLLMGRLGRSTVPEHGSDLQITGKPGATRAGRR